MNCSTLRLSCLCFALLSPLAKPVFASTLFEKTEKSPSITQACQECVSFDLLALKFTPTSPDALKNILNSLIGSSMVGQDDGEGQRVIPPGKSAIVVSTFRQSGTLEQLLHWQAMSVQGESIPIASVSPSGTLSAVLKLNGMEPFPRNAEPPALLGFTFKSEQPGDSSSGFDTLASSGRILLQNDGTLLDINRQGHSYLIWLVRVIY